MIEKWKGRTIQSRADAAELLLDMIRPLKPYYSKGNAWLHAGDSGVHYGEKSSRMEGFARVLWGLGPLWSQESPALSKELKEEARSGSSGISPELYTVQTLHMKNIGGIWSIMIRKW